VVSSKEYGSSLVNEFNSKSYEISTISTSLEFELSKLPPYFLEEILVPVFPTSSR
jgi:hypothetical protein